MMEKPSRILKIKAVRNKQYRIYVRGHIEIAKLSANIVQKYEMYLRPSLYEHLNIKSMTRAEALIMEEKLAWSLRRQGYAVWFN